TCLVIKKIMNERSTYSQRGDAAFAYDLLISFDFVFIFHLVKEIMDNADVLSRVLQQKYQDIVNVRQLLASSKLLIQSLRDNGWENLLNDVRIMSIIILKSLK
ncbi:hypothetical protein CFOL_v3_20568, partial [Cephalotus follicularis]